jgi:hypothetical protein
MSRVDNRHRISSTKISCGSGNIRDKFQYQKSAYPVRSRVMSQPTSPVSPPAIARDSDSVIEDHGPPADTIQPAKQHFVTLAGNAFVDYAAMLRLCVRGSDAPEV